MSAEDSPSSYPAGTALGILIVVSTALGTAHVGHEVAVTGPQPVTVTILLGSIAALVLGIAMCSGIMGRQPQRAPSLDR